MYITAFETMTACGTVPPWEVFCNQRRLRNVVDPGASPHALRNQAGLRRMVEAYQSVVIDHVLKGSRTPVASALAR